MTGVFAVVCGPRSGTPRLPVTCVPLERRPTHPDAANRRRTLCPLPASSPGRAWFPHLPDRGLLFADLDDKHRVGGDSNFSRRPITGKGVAGGGMILSFCTRPGRAKVFHYSRPTRPGHCLPHSHVNAYLNTTLATYPVGTARTRRRGCIACLTGCRLPACTGSGEQRLHYLRGRLAVSGWHLSE